MAIKKMYKAISHITGEIELIEYDFLSGYVILDTIEVEYDDTLTNEHRLLLADAIGESVKKQEADVKKAYLKIQYTKHKIEQLLCLENKAPVFTDDDAPF